MPATIAVAIAERRRTSPRIASRDSTAKTAGPERCSTAPGAPASSRAAAKAAPISARFDSCASRSKPGAAVCTSSSAVR